MVGWRQTSARGVRMNLRSAKHAASFMNAFTDYLLPSAPDVDFKTAPLSASRDNLEEMCELGQRFISPMERCGGAFFHEAEVESSLMEDVEQTAAACKVQSWHLFSFYPWSLMIQDARRGGRNMQQQQEQQHWTRGSTLWSSRSRDGWLAADITWVVRMNLHPTQMWPGST